MPQSSSHQEWLTMLRAYAKGDLDNESRAIVEERLAKDPKAKTQLDYFKRMYGGNVTAPPNQRKEITQGFASYKRQMWLAKAALYAVPVLVVLSASWYYLNTNTGETNVTINERKAPVAKQDTLLERVPLSEKHKDSVFLPSDSVQLLARNDASKKPPTNNLPDTRDSAIKLKPKNASLQDKDTSRQKEESIQTVPEKKERKAKLFYTCTDGKRGLVGGKALFEYVPFYDKAEQKAYVVHDDEVFPVELNLEPTGLFPIEDSKERTRIMKRFETYIQSNGFYQILGLIADNRGALLDSSRAFPVLYYQAVPLESPRIEQLDYFGTVVCLPFSFAKEAYSFYKFEDEHYVVPNNGLVAYRFESLSPQKPMFAEKILNPLKTRKIRKSGVLLK